MIKNYLSLNVYNSVKKQLRQLRTLFKKRILQKENFKLSSQVDNIQWVSAKMAGPFWHPPPPLIIFFNFFLASLFLTELEMCPRSYGALSSLCAPQHTLVLTWEISLFKSWHLHSIFHSVNQNYWHGEPQERGQASDNNNSSLIEQ